MPENVAPQQPHEYRQSKMEAVVCSIKNMSAEKIDLVHQKLYTAMQAEPSNLYFLRFWRLAEGFVSLQEVPLTQDELSILGRSILLHRVQLGKATTFTWSEMAYETHPAAGQEPTQPQPATDTPLNDASTDTPPTDAAS